MDEEHKHTPEKKETVTISKVDLWRSATAVLAILLIISVFTGGFGYGEGSGTAAQPSAPAAAPSPSAPAPSPTIDMKALASNDPVEGDPNAPVTIIEFSDFECPFCGRFYGDTLGQIRSQYIDTGKVKLVYRDFPLSFHPNAQKAAESAECANEQGKFWEMHDMLFESGVQGGVATFKQYAANIGLNTATFNSCLDSGKYASETAADMNEGSAAGIRGTPGFIINGRLVSGAQPFSAFQQVIEAALAE
ncbi:MAG TPA: DsbA family protein [Candidatus Nanoarchaeia archaeon]|nr:DsbA family protein [Candidatus Nanoarchaeia archaeon]